jgi:dienelactone hydrolase
MSQLTPYPYKDGQISLSGWLALPERPPRAAIIVFPTIANLTPRVAEKAALLASLGYVVLVADYYGTELAERGNAPALAAELRQDNSAYRGRLRSAVDALRHSPAAKGLPIAAVGFCMGGQAVLEMARAGENLAVAVSFHGLLETSDPAKAGDRIIPRILVCHGDKDPLAPREQVGAFMKEMDRCGARWHLHIYSTALHGFTDPANDDRPLDAVAYDASADRQSWIAMNALFDEVFG